MVNAVHVRKFDLTVPVAAILVNPSLSCSHSSYCSFGLGHEAGYVTKRFLVVKLSSGFHWKTKARVRKYLAALENPKMFSGHEHNIFIDITKNKLFCFLKLKHQRKMKNIFSQIFFLPNNDTLIFSVNNHVSVHAVCKSINMWWVFILCLEGETENYFSIQHKIMQKDQYKFLFQLD